MSIYTRCIYVPASFTIGSIVEYMGKEYKILAFPYSSGNTMKRKYARVIERSLLK